MAATVSWKGPLSQVLDARKLPELRYLPFVGEANMKTFYVKNIPSHWDEVSLH